MKLKNDFKNKMMTLTKFYGELNQKYHLDPHDPNFKQKLKKNNQEQLSKRAQPVRYIK